ncbi:hypothetical protein [Paenibacillus ihuae]|uniref:hypothetical protein n=1 Tax=Paenibacillus ihuae TaxID=1232431 RepID=UPI0006D54399|nr:hypothetical protein [Paenibacillus ihuae]
MIIVLIAISLIGCSNNKESEHPLLPYPPVVVWDNKAFVVTENTIQEDQVGEIVGTVKRYIDPNKAVPERDGDSTIAPVGSEFYQIKGQEVTSIIAVLINGEYRKAFR